LKKLLTLIAIAITTAAQAELTSQQFAQLKAWAESRSYLYEGTDSIFGTQCFVFIDHGTNMFGLVPTSSDTADEAINALIASTLTCRHVSELTKQVVAEVRAETATPAPTIDHLIESGQKPDTATTHQEITEDVGAGDSSELNLVDNVKIIKARWDKDGFGTVAVWQVTLKNTSNKTLGNFKFRTVYKSETGKVVDRGGVDSVLSNGEVPKKILPGKTRTIEINDGFVHSEADNASFELVSVEEIK
jgi:hypothetical protein